ncbi:DUF4381 domain-containing protein [Ruegeria sp. R13_0]|uniref:DUF4381 domain-containing protein n=1 Tax=Ruegeria sp. R13_0 TaxID=2821099 RepID=UPI001ADB3359|nr:DUF4381 domain-containing protein [Ruegeria sp. R13_0]MBO9435963.1 DUF4381 domain-containing protein [Ruegeria sp. R13_0]
MSIDTTGKSLVDLLNMLEPAPEPSPISMMPQTWGWAALAVLLLVVLFAAVSVFRKNRRANAYRRAALEELSAPDIPTARIAEVLRRTALAAYPRDKVAGLYGDEWVKFLNQSSDMPSLNQELSHALTEAPYKTTPSNEDLRQMARHWVKSHKPYRSA